MKRSALAAAAAVVLLGVWGAAQAIGNTVHKRTVPPPLVITSDKSVSDGCWAHFYRQDNFKGEALDVVGPVAVPYLWRGGGYPWAPQYESIAVGPAATLTVYDARNFHDVTATFRPDQRVADLDRMMGIFRSVRSLKVSCPAG